MKGGFLNKLAQSKAVLYVLLAFAVFTLLGYLVNNNLAAIILFLLVGFVSTYLTKNMIYVLFVSILLTNFLVGMGVLGKLGIKEGMTGEDDDDDDEDDDEGFDNNDDDEGFDNDDDREGMYKGRPIQQEAQLVRKAEAGDRTKAKKKRQAGQKPQPLSKDDDAPGSNKPKNSKKKSGYANLDDEDMSVVNTRVDRAKTVEEAYESLGNILGSEGMQKLNVDASKLAKNQEGLFKAIEKMEPMMKMAESMLSKIDSGPLSKLVGLSTGSKKVGYNDDNEE